MATCELGCGEYRVLIQNRCGTQTVCELTEWVSDIDAPSGRLLDDTSEVTVTVSLAAGANGETCCECVGQVHSWIHSLTILRDGDVLWGPGPVTAPVWKSNTFEVTARDVSAWLDVRVIHNDLIFEDADPVDIAEAIIRDAMLPDDPCGLADAIIRIPDPVGVALPVISKTYTAGTQYAGEALRELARTTIDYTVVGRSIILGRDLTFGPYTPLTDEDFQTELVIEERGVEAATKWYVNGDTVAGQAGGLDPYYGLLEQIAEEENLTDEAEADAAALGRLTATNPAPIYLSVPQGATLSPRAPVCPETLVPGTLFNVIIRDMCKDVGAQMRLTALSFKVSGGDEQIGVTLAPVGTTADQGDAL